MNHFNVSLIVWAKSQDSVHKPQFLKREKKSRSRSNRGPSAYQPSALPFRLHRLTSLCRLFTSQKSFGRDYRPRSRVYVHARRSQSRVKDPIAHITVHRIMQTLKHPACTALSELVFPGESDSNSQWHNTAIKAQKAHFLKRDNKKNK